MYREKPLAIALNITFLIAHSFTLIAFLFRKQYSFAAETGIVLFSYCVLIIFEKVKDFRLENYIRLLLIVTAVLNNFVGEYVGLYYTTQFFDKYLHMFGTFSFALAGYSLIRKTISPTPESRVFTFILLISLGALAGIGMEIAEFLSDVFLKTYNQFGLQDTNLDMIFDIMGAALAAAFSASKTGTLLKN